VRSRFRIVLGGYARCEPQGFETPFHCGRPSAEKLVPRSRMLICWEWKIPSMPTRQLVVISYFSRSSCSQPVRRSGCDRQSRLSTCAQDSGARIVLRAACLPTAPACNLAKERAVAVSVLTRRRAGRPDPHDPDVRTDAAANIAVDLPVVSGSTEVADNMSFLVTSGAAAILYTGLYFLPESTSAVSNSARLPVCPVHSTLHVEETSWTATG
jgi:hypothetical protein